MKIKVLFSLLILPLVISCSEGDSENTAISSTAQDITNIELTNRSGDCTDYAGSFSSSVTDIGRNTSFSGSLIISSSSGSCSFVSNGIPNHDFNDASSFATDAATVDQTFSVTASPTDASSTTALSLSYDNAIFLNGAKLDLLPAACYGVGSEPLGQEKIGCGDMSYAWRYDPMFSGNNFGTDSHNAHTQPNGAYHYHGSPLALFDNTSPTAASPVVGFAADGYPIFGPYIDDGGTIRLAVASYRLRTGTRSLGDVTNSIVTQEGASPGGTYDGTYRDDYEYVASMGDLDECNGMTVNGVYGYYITNAFPWVMNCFKGTPDSTFRK